MSENINQTPSHVDEEESHSRSAACIFLENTLIPAIIDKEKERPSVFTLLDKFRKVNPEIGDALSLEDIKSEVSSRIYYKYAPGNFSPLVVAEAYELVEKAINIKENLSKTKA
jgi:hypothetical protein